MRSMFKHEILVGVLVSILAIVLTGYYISTYHKISTPSPNTKNTVKSVNPRITEAVQNIALSPAEVQKHNSASDCWVIDNNNVYNVTKYLDLHPGGANEIIPFCGKDMTAAYDTKGDRNKPHSSSADQILKQFLIGTIGTEVNSQTIENAGNTVQNIPNRRGGAEDDD